MVQAGLTPAQALLAATGGAARVIGFPTWGRSLRRPGPTSCPYAPIPSPRSATRGASSLCRLPETACRRGSSARLRCRRMVVPMATAAKLVYPYIVKEEGYCGGKAAIGNTRVRVNNVVFLHKQGRTAEQIIVEYPDLNLAQVHSALAYYYDHQDEIDAELARDEGADERYERRRAEALTRRRARE